MSGNDRKCALCMKASSRRCTGCDKAWYCSAECQKKHWVQHIFDCNPKRPITTADRLALSIFRLGIPDNLQTLLDYGFSHPSMAKLQTQLTGVYLDVFNKLHFKAQAVHKAREAGTLAQEIQDAYEKLPARERGWHYTFFMQNKVVFEGLGGTTRQPRMSQLYSTQIDAAKDVGVRAWEAMGGRPGITPRQVRTEFQRLSPQRQVCSALYVNIVANIIPSPEFPEWRAFGFCACTTDGETCRLVNIYADLIKRCTFDEFCTAHAEAKLIAMLRDKGVGTFPIDHPIMDVLNDRSKAKKSVWGLKEYVKRVNSLVFGPPASKIPPAFKADYGFKNCKSDEEHERLKKLYRAYFDRADQRPLLLHRAAMEGRLLEYIGEEMQIELKPRLYARLLKNSHTTPRPSSK